MQEWREKMSSKGWSDFFIDDFVKLNLQPSFRYGMNDFGHTIHITFKTKEDMHLYKLAGNEYYLNNCVMEVED
jgi:hypothetical protein